MNKNELKNERNERNEDQNENNDKIYQMRQSQMTGLIQQISKGTKIKIDEVKTYIIFTAIIIGIISYLFYDNMKYMRAELTNTSSKIDVVLSQNTYMTKNMKALSGTICYTCHNTTNMFLPKTTLRLEEFVKYVRGDRFVTNSVMPVFGEKDISYEKLQDIWKTLY
jgi:hypothetical protein